MKLTKDHIGELVSNGDDSSWAYLVVGFKKGEVLFYGMDGGFFIESASYDDWHLYKANVKEKWLQDGWKTGRRMP